MKKTFSFIFTFLVAAGFAARTIPVSTAVSPSTAEVIGTEEARILSQTLIVLSALLDQLRAVSENPATTAETKAALSNVLGGIANQLVSLNASLENRALAVGTPQETKEMQSSPPAEKQPLKVTVESSPSKREDFMIFKDSEEEERATKTLAVAEVRANLNLGNFLWTALASLVIAGIVVLLWPKAEKAAEAPREREISAVSSESAEGIPPDY